MTIVIGLILVAAAIVFSAWYVSSSRARHQRAGQLTLQHTSQLDRALHQLIDEVSNEVPLPRAARGTPHRHLGARPQEALDDEVTGPRASSGPSGGLPGHGLFH